MTHAVKTRFLSGLAALVLVAAAAPPPYAVTRSIGVPDGGWDYAKIDPATHKLYIARATNVTVVDLAHGDTVTSIGTIAKSHAVVPVGGSLLLVTSGKDDSVRLLDTGNGREIARIAVGTDPDGAFFDQASGLAVVMNAKAGTVSVIDVAKRVVARTVTLRPGLEYAALGSDGTVFVNNEDQSEIETFDLMSGKPGPVIAMPGCEGPTGLGYDAKTQRVISACANGHAAVIDARAKRFVKLLPIGAGPDAVIVDAPRRLAFVPCGRYGMLSVIALDAPGGPAVTGTVRTETGARTGALDPATGALYLPTARFGPASAGGQRPAALAGTFHVVMVSRQ